MARIGLLTLGATFRPAKKAHLPDTSNMIQLYKTTSSLIGLGSSSGGGRRHMLYMIFGLVEFLDIE